MVTSRELTELRTVLSRAKTAYATIKANHEWRHENETVPTKEQRVKMLGDLAMAISYLEKYSR